MRSAYPAVFLCALACASVPSSSRLSTTNSEVRPALLAASSNSTASSNRGSFITGTFSTEYFTGETLYEALRRRAPLYLYARPTPSMELTGRTDPIAVYINGSFSGSLDVLQSIPASEVFAVERLTATEAAIKYGPKHGSGALLVHLVRHD